MKHLGLTSRVRRLERKGKVKRPRRPVVFKLYDEPDDRVAGIDTIAGPLCDRRWSEGADSLISRARSLTGPRQVLLCRYPTPTPETALCDDPGAMPEPAPLPVFDRHLPDPVKRWREFNESNSHEAID